MKVQNTWMVIPRRRLSKLPEEISRIEARPAPTNALTVEPKLLMDMKSANRVPSMPGGQSCPDKMRNGINLQSQMTAFKFDGLAFIVSVT